MRVLLALAALTAVQGQDLSLDQIRRINLDRAANMPNFVVDEFVTEYSAPHHTGPAASAKWQYEHNYQSEVTVNGTAITHRNPLRDGLPWDKIGVASGMPASMPATGFGAPLKALFDPECPTRLSYAGKELMAGRTAVIYRFHSPVNACFGNVYGRDRAYNAARSGRVLIDPSTGDVLQYEEEASGLPQGFLFKQRNLTMTWSAVTIAGSSYWLPVHADFLWRTNESLNHRSVEYKNHRHFVAETNFLVK